MATSRPFAYNTGSSIAGALQYGNIAVGSASLAYEDLDPGGLQWWNGPDEDLGYVIAYPILGGGRSTPTGVDAYLGFQRSPSKTDNSFVDTVNYYYGQSFTTGLQAFTYVSSSGFWTNWSGIDTSGLILNWDIQNVSSYGGSGTTITDLQSNSNGTLVGTIDYISGTPNYLNVQGGTTEYIVSATNLNSKLSPANTGTSISHFVWVYPTGNGVIVNEQGTTTPAVSWHDTQIEIVSGALKFRLWNLASPYLTSNTSLTLNTWNYIGLTYDGTTFRGYLNGVQVASTSPFTRLVPYNYGSGLYYSLGATDAVTNMGDGNGATFRFGAFQVYNRGLSSTEVLNNYNATKGNYGL